MPSEAGSGSDPSINWSDTPSSEGPWYTHKGAPIVALALRQPSFSVGSSLHANATCQPCAFYWAKSGCSSGASCTFCHMCPKGSIQSKRKKHREYVNATYPRNKADQSPASNSTPSSLAAASVASAASATRKKQKPRRRRRPRNAASSDGSQAASGSLASSGSQAGSISGSQAGSISGSQGRGCGYRGSGFQGASGSLGQGRGFQGRRPKSKAAPKSGVASKAAPKPAVELSQPVPTKMSL